MAWHIAEDTLEGEVLTWLEGVGYATGHGEDFTPERLVDPERESWADSVLIHRLERAVARLNPDIDAGDRADAIRKALRTNHPTTIENNRAFHHLLIDGVDVPWRDDHGNTRYRKLRLIDLDRPENNEWLALQQFTIEEKEHRRRRPDVVIFVNGLPLVVLELKRPTEDNMVGAFNQLQTYISDLPNLMRYNLALVASNADEARMGTITAGIDRFMPWRSTDGEDLVDRGRLELRTLVLGALRPDRIIDLLRSFVLFEEGRDGVISKKIAGYHQYFAVNQAVAETLRATSPEGDRKIGVIWHTQGSGKSLSMLFLVGKLFRQVTLENPTIVMLTDRNDLDNQLFAQFGRATDLLRQEPDQAESRVDLRDKLSTRAGGIIFTTLQKFSGESGDRQAVSTRRNIIVIADEAHRSQYDFIDGLAARMRAALPNASFIGFTGTPVELDDKNTRAVFGSYIDAYAMPQAVEDGATVPIYWENRLVPLALDDKAKDQIDREFEGLTETDEQDEREGHKTKWAALEKIVGSEPRIAKIAGDMVAHLEKRQEAMRGKAMIVAMSRRIAVDLYEAIVALRPDWHGERDTEGRIKVVMTGGPTDPNRFQPHIRNKQARGEIEKRFKDSDDPLDIVIVRDMWLTGFDVPSLHTMYVDKPMQGHGLMQAIARVNRVFRDKPGGLIVDYYGLSTQLKAAMANYGTKQETEFAIDQDEAVALLGEKIEVLDAMLHGFRWRARAASAGTATQKLEVLKDAEDFIISEDATSNSDLKRRYLKAADEMSKAFALAMPHEDALALRDDVSFLQQVAKKLRQHTVDAHREAELTDAAIQQLISRSVVADDVLDIFAAAGEANPDISILSERFLAEVAQMPQKNLALEALRKLLNDEVKIRNARNAIEAMKFSDMLQKTINRYQNRSIDTAEAMQELMRLAREMEQSKQRGDELGMSDQELAFYDALLAVDSVREAMDHERIRAVVHDVVIAVQRSATLDWSKSGQRQAKLRSAVRRALINHKITDSDTRDNLVELIFEQALRIAA